MTGSLGLIIRKAPLTSRVPDLAAFDLATLIEQDGYIHSAPQLLVEVLSPGERSEEKLADYKIQHNSQSIDGLPGVRTR